MTWTVLLALGHAKNAAVALAALAGLVEGRRRGLALPLLAAAATLGLVQLAGGLWYGVSAVGLAYAAAPAVGLGLALGARRWLRPGWAVAVGASAAFGAVMGTWALRFGLDAMVAQVLTGDVLLQGLRVLLLGTAVTGAGFGAVRAALTVGPPRRALPRDDRAP